MKPATARSLPEAALRNNGHDVMEDASPALFSKPFVEVLVLAIDGGHVSLRPGAGLFNLTVAALADLFAAHGGAYLVDL